MSFDNVSIIILGLIVVSVLALVYGDHEVLVMVVGGLLGFLSKDKVVPSMAGSKSMSDVVGIDIPSSLSEEVVAGDIVDNVNKADEQ